MARNTDVHMSKKQIPSEGIELSLPEGKVLKRIHLDLSPEGISLATVGAASTVLPNGKRQVVKLAPSKDGVTLSVVGAASSSTK